MDVAMDPISNPKIAAEAAEFALMLFIVFFIPMITFIGCISALISKLLERNSRKIVQISAIITLTLISFIGFIYHNGNYGIFWYIVQLIAVLWFPAAIVLSSLIVPGVTRTKSLPIWVFLMTILVAFIEYGFVRIESFIGLRSGNALIVFAAPPFPFELWRMPQIYQVIIQFFVTLALASLIFWLGLKLSQYIYRGKETST